MRKRDDLIDIGLLILRVALGVSMMFHGIPKIMGGSETWEYIGSTMSNFGVNFGHEFWGLLAALTEAVGGLFFALGFLFRPVSVLLFVTMVVALITHLSMGDSFLVYGHALDLLIVFFATIFMGAGKYSLDSRFIPKIA